MYLCNSKNNIMFALVEIGGHQFKVSSNDEIFVYKLDGKEGDKEDEKDKNSTPPVKDDTNFSSLFLSNACRKEKRTPD